MKMDKTSYMLLKTAIKSIADKAGKARLEEHKDVIAGDQHAKDKTKRFRWDLMYAAMREEGYKPPRDLFDNHIDTALKQIMSELKLV